MKDRFTLFAILGRSRVRLRLHVPRGQQPDGAFQAGPLSWCSAGTTCVAVAGYMKSDVGNFKRAFSKAIGGPPRT